MIDNNFMPSQWRDVLRVADPERVIVALDHRAPASTVASATAHNTGRKFVEKFGIRRFHDVSADQGIAHQLVSDYGYALPGTVPLCGDSHTCCAGAWRAAWARRAEAR